MTAPASPEPTDEQLLHAAEVVNWRENGRLVTDSAIVTRVARALAAAVTAEREKMLAVADAIGAEHVDDAYSRGFHDGAQYVARRIREVSR